jgi:hypothetical protein
MDYTPKPLTPLIDDIEALLRALDPKSDLTAGLVSNLKSELVEIGCKGAMYIPGKKAETTKQA